ncbi:MAG TPA: hypothetical protein PK156_36925, partial [Polyangium sp.]|nr:hypothetical protein [Polyangium sp.]
MRAYLSKDSSFLAFGADASIGCDGCNTSPVGSLFPDKPNQGIGRKVSLIAGPGGVAMGAPGIAAAGAANGVALRDTLGIRSRVGGASADDVWKGKPDAPSAIGCEGTDGGAGGTSGGAENGVALRDTLGIRSRAAGVSADGVWKGKPDAPSAIGCEGTDGGAGGTSGGAENGVAL